MATLLACTYLLTPIVVWASMFRAKWRKLVRQALIATGVSAALISVALNSAYAFAVEGSIMPGQVALAVGVFWGLLLVLRGLFVGFRELATRFLRPRWLGVGLAYVIMALVGLPWVMGVGMTWRLKVTPSDTPERFGLKYEPLDFASSDGVELSGWFIMPRAGAAPRTVVICHGLGAGKSNHMILALELVHEDDWNVLIFDFRAHGESGGQVSTFGDRESLDVAAAVDWLKRERPANARSVCGLGVSMGGAALLDYASKHPEQLDGVVVICTYGWMDTLAPQVASKVAPWPFYTIVSEAGVLMAELHAGRRFSRFAPGSNIAAIPRLTVIHGKQDELIPVEQAHRMSRVPRSADLRLELLEGDHNSLIGAPHVSRLYREQFAVYSAAAARQRSATTQPSTGAATSPSAR